MTPFRTPTHPQPPYADRAFRSALGMPTGVLLLAIGAWLGGDTVAHGTGRTPWLVLSILLLAAPLVIAFTIRPVLYAGDARMRVRNPFRTVTIPWGAVEELRSGYSTEVCAGGRTYQIWSIPVSLRARSKALRRGRDAADPALAPCDQAVADLRELAARHGDQETAQGPVTVRWAFELIAPAAAGAVLTAVLAALG